MDRDAFTVALFLMSPEGVRLLGQTAAPDVVRTVRDHLASTRRRELAQIVGPVRRVANQTDPKEGEQ